ncbi:hypothetical protein F0562_036111 [Nyssa sinensis]|uniref:DUF668 domain-containing protein n=1 Tax=Nyssa sinensis TaxID=561372 RepID=A0A5J5AG98_9ASTE|nr:hypothetical protein F0562_036111 [Nyssa sinensis]
MGGVCTAGTMKRKPEFQEKSSGFSGKLKSMNSFGKQEEPYDTSEMDVFEKMPQSYDTGELPLSISRELKPSVPTRTGPTKVSQKSTFLGRVGFVGLERAVEVLDTLGSSMSSLNPNSGFVSGMASRGNKIFILAFEIANTIAKGANLLQSLSEENVQFLKKEILHSEGVQKLVSTDMKELLTIAAADKRKEFDIFSREVIRFGDLCKDPQLHNLDRCFSILDSDHATQKQQREEAEMTMQELTTLAQHTSELYHELNALDRFEQDYRQNLEEVESLHLPRKGESVLILQSELKHQRKLVKRLKKKSLWAKGLEEVVEMLVDIVTFVHQEILEAFGDNGFVLVGKDVNKPERLGVAGLALHYANIVNQIDNIASRPTYFPPSMRDALYHGLPNSVKVVLRSRLQTVDAEEDLTIPQIKAEMEKTLQWLAPVATNTTKAHQGFGWVGEWANTGTDFSKKVTTNNNMIRIQTLYHADKQKTDLHLLELLTWLHRLISLVSHRDNVIKTLPVRSPARKGLILQPARHGLPTLNDVYKTHRVQLSPEDRTLLEEVMKRRRLVPGISKSQEFAITENKGTKVWALSRSTGSSPNKKLERPKSSVLDVLDGLDTTF